MSEAPEDLDATTATLLLAVVLLDSAGLSPVKATPRDKAFVQTMQERLGLSAEARDELYQALSNAKFDPR